MQVRAALMVWLTLVMGCPWTPPWIRAGADAGEPAPSKTDRSDGGAPRNDPDAGYPDAGRMDASVMCLQGPQKFREPRTYGVVNGTRAPQYAPLSTSQQLAVLALGFGASSGSDCSGTLVAERTVLTAQHCTEGENPPSMWAIFGPDDENPVLSIRVVQKREHPVHDVALLELESSPGDVLDVTPIPIALADLGQQDVGIQVENAGYGLTAPNGDSDGRYFVVEQLVGYEAAGNVFVVYGGGDRGVCFGDSGGPSLRINAEGEARVIGVLSWGDDSCVGRDRYARTDVARPWIEEWTGPTPGGAPAGCGSVTPEGQCTPSGTHAIYCGQGNTPIQQACEPGDHCQWDSVVTGWRCLPDAMDTCGGLTAYGTCDGQTLRWCDFGVVQARVCPQCGELCLLTNPREGFNCVESDCGDVTYLGMCDGPVAVWCTHDGRRRSANCADENQVCGWTDRDTGYYCLDHNNCGSLDFRGRCDGNVAEWCLRGDLRRRDCAAEGGVCAYVNDDVGYYCSSP